MIYEFYDLERIAFASSITSYSRSYSYGKRLSVEDDKILMITSLGDSKALRITDIESILPPPVCQLSSILSPETTGRIT